MYIKVFEFGFKKRNSCICNFAFSASLSDTQFVANSLSTKAENCKAQALGSVDITIGDKDLEFLTMA